MSAVTAVRGRVGVWRRAGGMGGRSLPYQPRRPGAVGRPRPGCCVVAVLRDRSRRRVELARSRFWRSPSASAATSRRSASRPREPIVWPRLMAEAQRVGPPAVLCLGGRRGADLGGVLFPRLVAGWLEAWSIAGGGGATLRRRFRAARARSCSRRCCSPPCTFASSRTDWTSRR